MQWSAKQYLKFEKERNIAIFDLVDKIKNQSNVNNILDLGCGPANSTQILQETFINAKILGIDNSLDMLQKAKSKNLKNCNFLQCDVNCELLEIKEKFDLVFANASIHWIENQNKLFKEVFELLNENGIFAVQLPLGKSSIFHQNLAKLAQKYGLDSRVFYALEAYEYYDILQNYFKEIQIWQSTYYHILSSLDEVIEWYKGSGLRPYLEKLDENLHAKFIEELKTTLAPFFPLQKDNSVLLPMSRLFFIAFKT
ncbi:methyltransferase domain-containing protein [Helicobacter burdigaliensis]|uniref:methyltransferase domain-containing protein n=1 Tax=Helicobacter burdigaliensis TaxID=2315334 RepID=UPI000EF6FCC5|nr:methyltransferase domain-containing protein [Helicobacter burdigaliensis]